MGDMKGTTESMGSTKTRNPVGSPENIFKKDLGHKSKFAQEVREILSHFQEKITIFEKVWISSTIF